jgi:hypothetical protein
MVGELSQSSSDENGTVPFGSAAEPLYVICRAGSGIGCQPVLRTNPHRFTRAVRTIAQWCRQHRHDPIEEQHAVLCQKLRGHAGYYGIVGNSPALARFYYEVLKVWRKWLMRRRRGGEFPGTGFANSWLAILCRICELFSPLYRGIANG